MTPQDPLRREPPEGDRQLRKWQQQAAPGCMRYGSEEDCDPACAEWCALSDEPTVERTAAGRGWLEEVSRRAGVDLWPDPIEARRVVTDDGSLIVVLGPIPPVTEPADGPGETR